MSYQTINKRKLKNFKILLVFITFCLILRPSLQQTTDYTQKVDNNIPQPTVIQVQPQKINITSQVTVPTIIQPPSIIYPLYYSRYDFNMHKNCTIQDNDIGKKIGDYVKFNKGQLGKFQDWDVQIIDGTYYDANQTVFAILTNGSIIKAQLKKKIEGENKITQFQLYNYQKNSTQYIWQLDQYELYMNAGSLYLFKDRKVFNINFIEGNKWEMNSVRNGNNVVSVYQHKDDLYLVKSKGIHKIVNGTVSSSLISSSPEDDSKRDFVDMSIDNGFMYILCRIEGIYLIDMINNYQIVQKYNYQYHQFAYKINVKNHTVLLNFKLYRKTYIGEFFFILSQIDSYPPAFRLNKFYYRFDEMNKVIMFQDFGLVYSLSQMNIFQHSINRKSPFTELQTEQLYRASFPKILDVIPLDDKKLHYLLIEKNGIFVESFGNDMENNTLFGTTMKCTFEQAGTFELNVTYQGFCKDYKNPTQAYCTKINTYKFEINDQKANRQVQTFNSHLFVYLILILILVLVIGAILAYRRHTIQRKQKLYAILQRRAQNNSELKNLG